ncbi:hypothetical protein F2Q69_00022586 [Brassica cretica]|uniref:Uncharacterized protein n=1 Tax=Brassica cretica TaxID=69181 RepID=A0A8S9PTK4_BRACR|nr:hypothetical protein F2Q69_00022586 [Brassica cretica]
MVRRNVPAGLRKLDQAQPTSFQINSAQSDGQLAHSAWSAGSQLNLAGQSVRVSGSWTGSGTDGRPCGLGTDWSLGYVQKAWVSDWAQDRPKKGQLWALGCKWPRGKEKCPEKDSNPVVQSTKAGHTHGSDSPYGRLDQRLGYLNGCKLPKVMSCKEARESKGYEFRKDVRSVPRKSRWTWAITQWYGSRPWAKSGLADCSKIVLIEELRLIMVNPKSREDSISERLCGVWAGESKSERSRKSKQAAGHSGQVIVDGTNPTGLPTDPVVANTGGELPTDPANITGTHQGNENGQQHQERE